MTADGCAAVRDNGQECPFYNHPPQKTLSRPLHVAAYQTATGRRLTDGQSAHPEPTQLS